MRTFSKLIALNPHAAVFLAGFVAYCGSMAAISPAFAGVSGGVILMGVAVYPVVVSRKGKD